MNKLTVSALFLLATSVSMPSFASSKTTCDDIDKLATKEVSISSTEMVAAKGDLPSYCRVTGTIQPQIGFEMRLPVENWNGKFYMAGCGAFCGAVGSDTPGFINSINYGLKRNYAVSTMDSGHEAASKVDGSWAHNNRDAEHNWGHRAVHKTANLTKLAIDEYYGNKPDLSYFAGCSTGGRMGAMEASKYPEDFDGIISGAPALNYTSLVATYFAWMVQHNTDKNGNEVISAHDLSIVENHIYDECDGKDGVVDGLIDDPRACNFRPQQLLCENGQAEACLTAPQVSALEKLYSRPTNSKGDALFAGAVPIGAEHFWKVWFTASPKDKKAMNKKVALKAKGLMSALNQNFLSYMAFENDPGDKISPTTYDFDKHPEKLDYMSNIYNADNPDLAKFKERGGKFLLWHGWGDMIIPPDMSIDYYERMVNRFGGIEKTQEFARFFLFPGMDHCGLVQGPGATQSGFDLLTALENWVERDTAPETVLLTKFDKDKKPVWTRPSCAYPQVSLFNGKGDASSPDSYQCGEAPHTQLSVQ